jgi:hypothetical protein
MTTIVSGTRGEGKAFRMLALYNAKNPPKMYVGKTQYDYAAWARIVMDSIEAEKKWNEKPKSPKIVPQIKPQPVDPPKPKKARKPRKKKEEPAPPKKRDKWETVKV